MVKTGSGTDFVYLCRQSKEIVEYSSLLIYLRIQKAATAPFFNGDGLGYVCDGYIDGDRGITGNMFHAFLILQRIP